MKYSTTETFPFNNFLLCNIKIFGIVEEIFMHFQIAFSNLLINDKRLDFLIMFGQGIGVTVRYFQELLYHYPNFINMVLICTIKFLIIRVHWVCL